jgi:hypothetical protein
MPEDDLFEIVLVCNFLCTVFTVAVMDFVSGATLSTACKNLLTYIFFQSEPTDTGFFFCVPRAITLATRRGRLPASAGPSARKHGLSAATGQRTCHFGFRFYPWPIDVNLKFYLRGNSSVNASAGATSRKWLLRNGCGFFYALEFK